MQSAHMILKHSNTGHRLMKPLRECLVGVSDNVTRFSHLGILDLRETCYLDPQTDRRLGHPDRLARQSESVRGREGECARGRGTKLTAITICC